MSKPENESQLWDMFLEGRALLLSNQAYLCEQYIENVDDWNNVLANETLNDNQWLHWCLVDMCRNKIEDILELMSEDDILVLNKQDISLLLVLDAKIEKSDLGNNLVDLIEVHGIEATYDIVIEEIIGLVTGIDEYTLKEASMYSEYYGS